MGRLYDESGLLERLAHGSLEYGLVGFEEPAGLGPGSDTRRDGPSDEDELPLSGDG